MTGKPLMVATLLGASIGVPYAVSHSTKEGQPGSTATPATSSAPWTPGQPTYSGHQPPLTAPSLNSSQIGTQSPTILPPVTTATRYHSIPTVFRFDVTREWVYQTWDRKSTGLGDPSMYGVRVALVTGTGLSDLAGALTYHFNAQGQVEHISFRGRTADTSAILQFLTSTYRFQRMEAPAGEQLYQVRSGNDVYSEFRSRPVSVLSSSTPHGSFGVVLELGRPGVNRPLVPQTPKLEIPPAAESSTPPKEQTAEAAKEGEGAESEPALIGKLRPATPAEESQVMSRRWPN